MALAVLLGSLRAAAGGSVESTLGAWPSSFEAVNVELRTERLLMRPPGNDDLEDLVAFHDEPLVRKFFGPATREEVIEWIAIARGDWGERGHGRVVLLDRECGTFLGRSGLRHWPGLQEIEVGWSLTAAARGRGLATEAGRFWLDWGFHELDAPYFTANIAPGNTASIAVAERLGMTPLREDELHGEPVMVYALSR
jgi:RimJ/RimL family protein N-acetyltransferase